MHTAALIASDGSIDWACLPYFDSPAVFFRLLDRRSGGYCAIRLSDVVRVSRKYIEDTNILETTFISSSGTVALTDFMPVQPQSDTQERSSRIIRLARCTAGHVDISFECRPTFAFNPATLRPHGLTSGTIQFEAQGQSLRIEGPNLSVRRDDTVMGTAQIAAGDTALFSISCAPQASPCRFLDVNSAHSALEETRRYWTEWSGRLRYQGDYRDEILRSILLLKLLTFAPTGAVVAAPTTSLPEVIGGNRNWDYRLSWIRDSQFVITALMHCGYDEEAHGFFRFLKKAADRAVDQLQILYDIRGDRAGDETEIQGLEGYRRSLPIRVGNAAARQKQSDIYGELLNCLFVYCHMAASKADKQHRAAEAWPLARALADHVVRHWQEPDQGIWESRESPRQFVHSKAMCWTALDRAIRLASLGGLTFDQTIWERERDAILESIRAHGFDTGVGAFVQSYGSRVLDAAVLRMPLQGVIQADDPRMLSTIKEIEGRLLRNGLLMRYTDGDGRSQEGAFTSCTLWLINNYILLGRMDQAHEAFDHLLSFRNDLGLYSEEINPGNGEQLGNFPQALTHVAVISGIRHLEGLRPGSLHTLP
jgi:alpha,alpha-trehalase